MLQPIAKPAAQGQSSGWPWGVVLFLSLLPLRALSGPIKAPSLNSTDEPELKKALTSFFIAPTNQQAKWKFPSADRTTGHNVQPSLRILCETLRRRGDPESAFTAEIDLALAAQQGFK